MRYLTSLILITTLLAGCGSPTAPPPLDGPATPTVPPAASPAAHTPPTAGTPPSSIPSSSCTKSLFSEWGTKTTPGNLLTGVYIGPYANNPTYQLDLTGLSFGLNYATFKKDASHVCYYYLTINSSNITINDFQGCNPGDIPPGGTANDQCNYCPGAQEPSPHTLNWALNYTLSCNALKIVDTHNSITLNYQ